MLGIVAGHLDDPNSLEPVFRELEDGNPGFTMGVGTVDSDEVILTSGRGGVRHLWIERGEGRVYLPEGYRTQEGDGARLPDEYRTAAVDPDVLATLHTLAHRVETFHPRLQAPVRAIIARLHGTTFIGDIAGEVWLIIESGVPPEEWTADQDASLALDIIIARYRDLGWSVKQTGSYEPITAGDQVTVTGDQPLRAGGRFRSWWIEYGERTTHISAARRLRYLKDTAGGCNFSFDAFRRLPMTWYANTGTPDQPDGINRINSHVVNIAAETSQTHYHPAIPVGGGRPQSELYLVLDPAMYRLNTYGRRAFLHTFPDLQDLSVYDETPLRPGSTIYIRPDTGHRGIDVFVNVITLPGFKPRNEIYLDQAIKDTAHGRAPYNGNVAR